MQTQFTLSDFDFDLPEELIAQTPAHPRDHARLLVYDRATKTIRDDVFYNLGKYLYPGTTLVLNNTKVDKVRIRFDNKELFIVNKLDPQRAEVMVRPGRFFKHGKKFEIPETGLEVEVVGIKEDGLRVLRISTNWDDPALDTIRHTPFPPYIKADESLAEEYQTVYAKVSGSKAAPTAGLHFTPELLQKLAESFSFAEVTLDVGLGTFAPVKGENIDEHIMHAETFELKEDVAAQLSRAPHVTAVGTTSVRVLESVSSPEGVMTPGKGDTAIFIKPGYTYKRVNSLITNFHLPKSTLLMLVSALIGMDEMKRIYAHAIKERYRFFSFGDAMLLL